MNYVCPANFVDTGYVFGGLLRTRNFIEGIVAALVGVLIVFSLPISSFTTRIAVLISVCGPLLLVGITGINDDPLSVYLMSMYKWRSNRRLMIYNKKSKVREDDIVDVMLEQRTVADNLSDRIAQMRATRVNEMPESLVEGLDFVFEDDSEITRYSSSKS